MAVEIIGKMKPKNNQQFALMDAVDVEMPDGRRLDDWREGIRLKEVIVEDDNGVAKAENRLLQDGEDVTDEVRELLGANDPGEDEPETGGVIPTFNLIERGLPAVSMDGSEASAEMETADIIAAAESGAVKLVIGIDMGGNTIPFEAIMNSLRSSAAGVCAFAGAFDITGVPMTVTLMMTPEGCVAYITNLAKAVAVPTSIDLSAFETAGQIVESYADGTSKTTTLEFDELGNPIKITDGDGNVTEIVW